MLDTPICREQIKTLPAQVDVADCADLSPGPFQGVLCGALLWLSRYRASRPGRAQKKKDKVNERHHI